jgi:predicted glutamine amidotransferase
MSQYQSDRTVVAFEAFVDEQLDKDHYVKSIKDPTKRAIAHNERIVEAKVASVLWLSSSTPTFVVASILTSSSSYTLSRTTSSRRKAAISSGSSCSTGSRAIFTSRPGARTTT